MHIYIYIQNNNSSTQVKHDHGLSDGLFSANKPRISVVLPKRGAYLAQQLVGPVERGSSF